jgi:hypothetical protein
LTLGLLNHKKVSIYVKVLPCFSSFPCVLAFVIVQGR